VSFLHLNRTAEAEQLVEKFLDNSSYRRPIMMARFSKLPIDAACITAGLIFAAWAFYCVWG
jgi:hypothetical protein